MQRENGSKRRGNLDIDEFGYPASEQNFTHGISLPRYRINIYLNCVFA